jgi:hypothetical protein
MQLVFLIRIRKNDKKEWSNNGEPLKTSKSRLAPATKAEVPLGK